MVCSEERETDLLPNACKLSSQLNVIAGVAVATLHLVSVIVTYPLRSCWSVGLINIVSMLRRINDQLRVD